MGAYVAAYAGGKYLVLELNNGVYRDFAEACAMTDARRIAAALNGTVSA